MIKKGYKIENLTWDLKPRQINEVPQSNRMQIIINKCQL